ncbi:MAG: carboxypeptidase-like regulatory domain-containing protein [Planctomycetaceae bacterium]|jgi:hypothetical protein|nr:carboxypeptidase-like regulatory domain-containing protein [Planctomycetaceae bacterium]
MTKKIFLIVSFLFVAVIIAGCSDGKIKTNGVTGTVTYDGSPLAGATVIFSPVTDGQGNPAVGETDEKGVYVLQTILGNFGAGTTPGDYTVTVTKTELKKTGKKTTDGDGVVHEETKPVSVIPEKYAQAATSGFTATVKSGSNTFDFNLEK